MGRLRTFEESESDHHDDRGSKEDQLLLMTRTLESLLQKKKGASGASSSRTKGKVPPVCEQAGRGDRGHRRKKGGNGNGKQKKHRKFDITKVKCFNCDVNGHFASDCPEPKQEKTHLAEKEEDDDPGLLMIVACEEACDPS